MMYVCISDPLYLAVSTYVRFVLQHCVLLFKKESLVYIETEVMNILHSITLILLQYQFQDLLP